MDASQGQSILDQAYNALISIHNRDLWAVVPDGGLFHYTTAEGLLGIIQSGCLHASLAYLLNDASEVSYGCDIVLNAVAELRKTNRASALAQRILDDLLAGFSFESRRATWAHSIYVACFCEKDNLLSQWRAYGEPGGYSLGMAFSTSDTRLHPEPKTYTNRLMKVMYDREAQVQTCLALLRDIADAISPDDLNSAVENQNEYSFRRYERFYELIQDLIIEKIVAFKNPAFVEEQEWRLVARQRQLVKQGVDDGGKSPTEFYFRTSRGLTVPYIKLIPKQGPSVPGKPSFPLKSVRFGPTLNRAKGESALRQLLEMNRFQSNIAIFGSDIPVLL
jgi:Protein of unknown function (DUF2971)